MDSPINTIVAILEVCQTLGDCLTGLREDVFGPLKTQCRRLLEEVERAKRLHAALTKQMIRNESYTGLQEHLEKEKAILETVLERLQSSTPRRAQLHKRTQLRQFVVEKTKQLKKEMTSLIDSLKDYNFISVEKIYNYQLLPDEAEYEPDYSACDEIP
ncbi:hypothetical protein BSL78_17984 [Apostichopus japonicus]|uniref:Uncharacterized protein n=1 Tax=Stichopus japonicus TaxID=307972 RepID=A0A2G8KAW0_STIJA|nr:hypothetical protein BSL78_17984 [Apostichopus japonicus]